MADITYLSLGWGVQSWAIATMAAVGELPPIDLAIHADTGHEAQKTYEHAERRRGALMARGREREMNRFRHGSDTTRILTYVQPTRVFSAECKRHGCLGVGRTRKAMEQIVASHISAGPECGDATQHGGKAL